jgi:AcrR family transcriptional regulator
VPKSKRQQLVSAALDLVDEKGAGALTMRALAARVDRQVSSLYNHIDGRADLIEALRERIVAGIETSAFSTRPWDEALASWGRSYLNAFAAHPQLIAILATTPIRDQSTLRMYDTVIAALVQAGWPVSDSLAVVRTFEAHILGSALDIVAPGDLLTQSTTPDELSALQAALNPAYAESANASRAFQLGLAALVDGLRTEYARISRTP